LLFEKQSNQKRTYFGKYRTIWMGSVAFLGASLRLSTLDWMHSLIAVVALMTNRMIPMFGQRR
jgi:hypothetical protein